LREETENEVGQGEIENQQVARTAHACVGGDHVADEPVTGRAERDQCREQHDQDHLRRVEIITL